MAAFMVANAPPGMLSHPVVPVPSPVGRRRRRGFCHAALLAEAVAARTGLPVLPLLERVGAAQRQVGRPRNQRLRTPPRFAAVGAARVEVVLVDDVVTTGATLSACARALREAGCSCEKAVAFALTPVR
jgi:predicted amidophosphoribosyltransferase